ncbi:AraC family transcriptional regulator [Flavobacterium sp. EDS]|uniref:AraC family transcriptional regulator n=1 Tax=Flavobacterium sp. EDS TaxID=2897328 RepID=UPI001E45633D|nr:AraC family transcriptional regulator [Flavobacterium sp. EDS]MCD0474056.1 AraC family transcriptional regulator [Flavobacterium sp. EDS]
MIKDFINSNFGSDMKGLYVSFFKEYVGWEVNRPFKTSNFSMLLVRSGNLKLKINNQILLLSAHDLVYIPKNTICNLIDRNELLQVCIMITQQASFSSAFNTKNYPSITLNTIDFKLVLQLFKLLDLKNKNITYSIYNNELMKNSFNLFLYEIKIIYNKYRDCEAHGITRKELLVAQFINYIVLHCKERHSVQFFADALCISPGYLNRIVKQITDKTAKDLICEGLLIEAKILLKNSQITIFNIADELEFNNYSSFSTFFKRHTSLSPSEYRLQLNSH